MSRVVMQSRVCLGTTVKEVRRELGEPQKNSGDWYVYASAGRISGDCQAEGLDNELR